MIIVMVWCLRDGKIETIKKITRIFFMDDEVLEIKCVGMLLIACSPSIN
jgi:hypothetical protein